MTPEQKVRAAMPGTLAELAERTGYPQQEVLRQITMLRRLVRVKAQAGPAELTNRGRTFGPTVFMAVDNGESQE